MQGTRPTELRPRQVGRDSLLSTVWICIHHWSGPNHGAARDVAVHRQLNPLLPRLQATRRRVLGTRRRLRGIPHRAPTHRRRVSGVQAVLFVPSVIFTLTNLLFLLCPSIGQMRILCRRIPPGAGTLPAARQVGLFIFVQCLRVSCSIITPLLVLWLPASSCCRLPRRPAAG